MHLLRCQKSQGWIPDDYLTSIVGNCDRGQFVITQVMRVPASLTAEGELYLESTEARILAPEAVDLTTVRCQRCGGPVEWVEVDPEEILTQIREQEVDQKRRVGTSKRVREAEAEAAGVLDDTTDSSDELPTEERG